MQDHKPKQPVWLITTLVACLLGLLATQTIVSMRKKSVTVDEIIYILAGYYHLTTGDFYMNMTNPPLMKIVSGLPLLILNLELPAFTKKPKDLTIVEQWQYARDFLYHNKVDADAVLFLARLPIVMISVILGIFVFLFSKELYGENAGLFALFLYSFCPNILAHSQLATHDLGLTAFMFISAYYFWRYMTCPKVKFLTLCGIFLGLAMLTKTTALFLIPIYLTYALLCLLKNNGLGIYEKFPLVGRFKQSQLRLRQLMALASFFLALSSVSLLVLNIGYGFQGSFEPIPLPDPYIKLLQFQSQLQSNSGGVYFAGEIYHPGLWYLMIVTFLIKTPIPPLILLLISTIYMINNRKTLEAEWLMVVFISCIIGIFSYFSNINNGLRYILPIYPFIFVIISRLFYVGFLHYKPAKWLLATLSCWYFAGATLIHPHYLAYFNEFIGGPTNGYKYLSDSNLDWGQDLKTLKHYMEQKDIKRIKLAYFGSADASYYGIDYDYLPSVGLAPTKPGQYWWYEIDTDAKRYLEPQSGIIAVSATILASPQWLREKFHRSYTWLKKYEPVDKVGYSILIYHIP